MKRSTFNADLIDEDEDEYRHALARSASGTTLLLRRQLHLVRVPMPISQLFLAILVSGRSCLCPEYRLLPVRRDWRVHHRQRAGPMVSRLYQTDLAMAHVHLGLALSGISRISLSGIALLVSGAGGCHLGCRGCRLFLWWVIL